MLMGEHAVLHGKHALVAAASPRLHVHLTPRSDRILTIQSALGQYRCSLDDLKRAKPFEFILALIQQFKLHQGADLEIHSEFSATVGLGSSAAVLVATAAALFHWQTPQNLSLFDACYTSLIEVQGRGSGADLMAAILGGIVLYRREPQLAQQVWPHPGLISCPISLVYSGYKTPTAQVIQTVENLRQQNPGQYAIYFDQIDLCVKAGVNALQAGHLHDFAQAMQANQQAMRALGVSDPTLEAIITSLEKQPGTLAAKISGSGLGDCIVALGQPAYPADFPWTILEAQLSAQGVQIHA
jgi:mevalonate kinase